MKQKKTKKNYFIYAIIFIIIIIGIYIMSRTNTDFAKYSGTLYKTIIIFILITGLIGIKTK
jgi:NADH:ubiquinone oxidoreductase subunit 3 (subunit A)